MQLGRAENEHTAKEVIYDSLMTVYGTESFTSVATSCALLLCRCRDASKLQESGVSLLILICACVACSDCPIDGGCACRSATMLQ